jgi:hypothetical protein
MVAIVNSALSELDATKVRLEKQDQDQESLRIIDSVEARGSVTQLNRSISNLQGLEAFSERVKTTADSKLRSLREELKRLDDLRAGIPKRLDQITDMRTLDVLNTELLRNINLFDDAEGAHLMQGYVDRCERVREMFEQIITLERETVQSPTDAQRVVTALRQLLETSREYASEAQAGVISEAISNVEQAVQTKSEAAGAWLQGCEQALSCDEAPNDVLARLNSPPRFLSAAQLTRLQELLDETKRRQQSLQQEAASLAALGAIVARGSVVDIQRQVDVVAGLPAPTAKIRQNIEAKLVDLSRELSRLQEYKDSIPVKLDTVRDLRSLDETQSDLLRHLDLFEGTPSAAELQQQLDRCRQLKQFFNAVESCRRRTIVTPDDVQEVREQLNNLAADPGCTLSPLQLATTADISTYLESEAEKRSRDALRWLENCETAASTGRKDEELLATLRTPPPFLAEEERPRVEAIRLELAKRADCKRMEAASLVTLSATSPKGTLSELRGRISTVESLGAPTVSIQEQIDRKLSALRSELKKLTDFSGEISRRLDSACSATNVEEVQIDILRNVNLYDETSERVGLEENLDRCKYLRQLFEMVASCSTTETIRTPADAKAATEKLEELNGAEESRISSQHRLVLSAAIRTVENYVAAQADEAVKWVSECERKAAEGSDAAELNELLKSPHAFLPDAGRLRLEELIKQTSRRIDEDEVSLVLMHFRKIHDAPKRTECLNRLRAMVDES